MFFIYVTFFDKKNQDDQSCVFKVRNKNMFLATKVISSHRHLKFSKFQSRKFSRHIIERDSLLSKGLLPLRRIVSHGEYELRVDLEDFDDQARFAKYSGFSIGNSASNYKLEAIGYSGNANLESEIKAVRESIRGVNSELSMELNELRELISTTLCLLSVSAMRSLTGLQT